MKVGILTFHWANNPGALLQAYALTKIVKLLGHDVDIINYIPYPITHVPSPNLWNIRNGQYFAAKLKNYSYAKFKQIYLNLSGPPVTNNHELAELSNTYDAIIVGSDQIWNLDITKLNTSYFLDFASNTNCRLISYAASMGSENPPTKYDDIFTKYLPRFHHISTRELSAIKYVSKISGNRVTHVLDPTLLLEDYSDIVNFPRFNKDFMLGYIIHNYAHADVLALKAQLGIKFVYIGSGIARGWITPGLGRTRNFVGPREWLGWIAKANCFYTGSFHGIAFALHYNTPFYTYPLKKNNERINSLLELVGLSHRSIPSGTIKQNDDIDSNGIHWDSVNKKLVSERTKSIEFLKNALK